MLWFLPAFAALTYMYMAVAFSSTTFRVLLILLSFLGHCLVGLLPEESIKWIPFSAYISIYILAPALHFSVVRRFDRFGWQQIMIAGLVFCLACYLQREQRLTVVLSEFTVFSLTNVYALLVTDVQMLTGTFVCVALGQKVASSQILARLGNLSMKIYLTMDWSATSSTSLTSSSEQTCHHPSPSARPLASRCRSVTLFRSLSKRRG